MGVWVQRWPMRPSTLRRLRIATVALAAVVGVVVSVIARNAGALVLTPALVFMGLYLLTNWYGEPAIDEWDRLPEPVRMAMAREGHPAAASLARFDRVPEIRAEARRTFGR